MSNKKTAKATKKTANLPKAAPVSVRDDTHANGTFRSKVTMPAEGSYWPGAYAAFAQSATGSWQNLLPLLVIVLVYGLASFGTPPPGIGFSELLLFSYRQTLLTVALLASVWPVYCLAVADGRILTAGEWLSAALHRYVVALLVTIICIFVVLLSAFLFFLPLIWLGPWVSMAAYVAVDPKRKDDGVWDCFRESYRLTKGNKWKVWGIFATMLPILLGISLLIAAAAIYVDSPVLSVVSKALTSTAIVLASCALAMLYRWLQHNVTAK